MQENAISSTNVPSAILNLTGRRTVKSRLNRKLFSNLGRTAVVKETYLMN